MAGENEKMVSNITSYIPHMKSPNWKPFMFISSIPEAYIPVISIKKIQNLSTNLEEQSLKTIFWYLLLKKYLNILERKKEYHLFKLMSNLQIIDKNTLKFRENPKSISISTNKKKTEKVNNQIDIESTFYALSILKLIGRLDEFLSESEINKKKLILNYLFDIKQIIKEEKNQSEIKVLFYILSLYNLLGVYPKNHFQIKLFKHFLKSKTKGLETAYKLLCLKYLNLKDILDEDFLINLHKYENLNGGFKNQNSNKSSINNTFWIVYTLEMYKWLIPYRTGPVYSFIISELKKIPISINKITKNEIENSNEIIKLSKLVILLKTIYNSIITESEHLLFSNFSSKKLIDLKILSKKAGFINAEKEIIDFLNKKYQFTLEILNNRIIFRRYLNKLNPFKEKIAIKLFEKVNSNLEFDLSEFRRNFNRFKSKQHRIKDDYLIKLLNEMIDEKFFNGKINRKSKFLFFSVYSFHRNKFTDNFIVCNRSISLEDISKEKNRLENIKYDIFNMTKEISNSVNNIFNEIDSLLIVGINPEYIENRLKFSIKKALFDASFFNKTIEMFQNELIYFRPEFVLGNQIKDWNQIYSKIRLNFKNIRNILSIRINTLRKDIEQYELTRNLENSVEIKINYLMNELDKYQKEFKNHIETEYSREQVFFLETKFDLISKTLENIDQKIKKKSHKIFSKKREITKFRKEIINNWISHLEEFQSILDYYQMGFRIWKEKILKIDKQKEKYNNQIKIIKKEIMDAITKNEHNRALTINDKELSDLQENINNFSESLNKDIEKIYRKNRKLYSLFRSIQTEWQDNQNNLEKNIQKMRSDFQITIKNNLKIYLKEKFSLIIDKSITEIRNNLLNFEKKINSRIRREEEFPITNISKTLKKFHKDLKRKEKYIDEKLKKATKDIKHFDLKDILNKWIIFKDDFIKELENTSIKYHDEEIIHEVLNYAKDNKRIYISIEEIGLICKQKEKKILRDLNRIIYQNRINAILVGDPLKIEIHGVNWRNWNHLKKYTSSILREIQAKFNKLQLIFNNSIQKKEIFKNFDQIISLVSEFDKQILQILDKYEDFIIKENVNLDIKLIHKTYIEFHQKIQKIKLKAKNLSNSSKTIKKFHIFLNNIYIDIEDYINSEIHYINVEVKKIKKKINVNKNIKWLDTQKSSIDEKIQNFQEKIHNFKQQRQSFHSDVVIQKIEDNFNKKIQLFINSYIKNIENLKKKIFNFDIEKKSDKIEKLLNKKEKKLNQYAYNLDLEILNNIRARDFILASKEFKNRKKNLEKHLKIYDKEIKKNIKKLNKDSKKFKIKKSSIFLKEWNNFSNEFREIRYNAKKKAIQTELILKFTLFSLSSVKEDYIPLKFFTDELHLKHEIIKHTLMSLISDDILPGKLDIKYDIYFEGDKELDEKTIASLDIIKNTSLKTYLIIQRFSSVLSMLTPLLTVIAVGLQIIWWSTKFPTNLWLKFLPFFVLSGFIFILWLLKGKRKAKKLK